MAATSDALTTISQQEFEQGADRLGKLPDDVLLSILKRLDLRDAVRSSVLSRRWRHIPSVLPDIVLDVDSFDFKPVNDDGFKSKFKLSVTAGKNKAVARAAKSLLARRSHRPITNLSVAFYLRKDSIEIIRAVEVAMSSHGRGVVAANFTILRESVDDLQYDEPEMTRHGNIFLSYFNTCRRAFAGLTGLLVERVKLLESDIPNVLRTCQKLQWLSLVSCHTGRDKALVLEHPQLAELKLEHCHCYCIELKWLPKLSQLTCHTWLPSRTGRPLLLGHVPQLRRLMLLTADYGHYPTLKLSELLVNHAMLGELHLDFRIYRIWVQPERPRQLAPLLQNLKVVNLGSIFKECDLSWTLFLLQAAPILNTLQIKEYVT
ncbi:hypothetical protein QOZ80_4AG0313050 [Eleusine coracana subsp. coracana]|nr:hypothetical protein QOZ80_4AG0313050 [Eleusine coracana subsp. coracana]